MTQTATRISLSPSCLGRRMRFTGTTAVAASRTSGSTFALRPLVLRSQGSERHGLISTTTVILTCSRRTEP